MLHCHWPPTSSPSKQQNKHKQGHHGHPPPYHLNHHGNQDHCDQWPYCFNFLMHLQTVQDPWSSIHRPWSRHACLVMLKTLSGRESTRVVLLQSLLLLCPEGMLWCTKSRTDLHVAWYHCKATIYAFVHWASPVPSAYFLQNAWVLNRPLFLWKNNFDACTSVNPLIAKL